MLNIKNVRQKVRLFREKMTTGNGAIHRITYSVQSMLLLATFRSCYI